MPDRGGQRSLGRAIASGGAWSVGGQVVTLAASLFLTPIVIRKLGEAGYGLLSLANVVCGYVAIAELGMGSASTRFATEARERGDARRELAVIGTATTLVAGAYAFAIAVFVLASPALLAELRVPEGQRAVGARVIELAAVAFAARSLAGVLNTPMVVRMRLDLVTLINAGTSLAQTCVLPLVLLAGGSLPLGVALTSVIAIASVGCTVAASLRLMPSMRRPRVDAAVARALLRFGGAVIVTSLVSMVLSNVERLVLARISNLESLAHYSVTATLAGLVSLVPVGANQVLLPAFSRLQALPDRGPLLDLYRRAVPSLLLVLLPVGAVLVATGRPFLALWAGPAYGRGAGPLLYALVPGVVVGSLGHVPTILLYGLGRAGAIARLQLVQLPIYLVGAIYLTSVWGAQGAAIAVSLRCVMNVVLMFRGALDACPGASPDSLRRTWPAWLGIAPTVALAAFDLSLPVALACASAGVVLYAAVTWATVLASPEWAWLRTEILRLLRRPPPTP